MTRHQKHPLRALTIEEQQELERISRDSSGAASEPQDGNGQECDDRSTELAV